MSANIFGERFLGNRVPAWHGLGTVFTDQPTAVEAVHRAGLDFKVEKMPVCVDVNGEMVQTEDFGITRFPTSDDPLYRVFGYVSDQYKVLDNLAVAEKLDRITDIWPVETAAALGKGETMFLSLDAGEWEIDGETMHQYLLFTDTKTGGRSARFALTDVRVVCQNTLSMGLRQATITAAIQHDASAEAQLEWRITLLRKVEEAKQATQALFGKLVECKLDLAEAKAVFERAYPVKTPPKRMMAVSELSAEERAEFEEQGINMVDAKDWLRIMTARMEKRREAALSRYQADQWTDTTAETAWAAFNAVVEVEDYRGKPTESALVAMLFGDRARTKAQAFEYALALASK